MRDTGEGIPSLTNGRTGQGRGLHRREMYRLSSSVTSFQDGDLLARFSRYSRTFGGIRKSRAGRRPFAPPPPRVGVVRP